MVALAACGVADVLGDEIMSDPTIGSALEARRNELGLDKGRAAHRIGMSRTTYGSYERDAQRPSIEVFPSLIDFLDVSLEDFLVLYGATCVAIARASFAGTATPADTDEPAGSVGRGVSTESDAGHVGEVTVAIDDEDGDAVTARESEMQRLTPPTSIESAGPPGANSGGADDASMVGKELSKKSKKRKKGKGKKHR